MMENNSTQLIKLQLLIILFKHQSVKLSLLLSISAFHTNITDAVIRNNHYILHLQL